MLRVRGLGTGSPDGFGTQFHSASQVGYAQRDDTRDVVIEFRRESLGPFDPDADAARTVVLRLVTQVREFPVRVEIDRWEATVDEAGQPVAYTFIGNQDAWVAQRHLEDNWLIRVTATGLSSDQLALEEIDPSDL
jgi:hypothetical protein